MNMFKKVLAVVLSVLVIASFASIGMTASAEETTINGIRWFPVPENRQNDDAWEVECWAEGCLCQRFTETAESNGYTNFLDTEYTENGGLTISRNETEIIMNDQDYTANFWPRIRTISLETSPEFDMKTADTFYFDFVAHEGTSWNVLLSINGIGIKLSKAISDAAGVSGVANSDADGAPGAYKGSFSIQAAIEEISKESGTESGTNAVALKNMKKTFVPQLAIFCVGPTTASLTINEMFISTADDTTGANCSFVDMGLLTGYGDEWYELQEEEGAENTDGDETETPDAGNEPASPDEGPAGEDTPAVDAETDDDKKDDDKKDDKEDKGDKNGGGNGGLIVVLVILGVVAVLAVVAVVVIVVLKKKA